MVVGPAPGARAWPDDDRGRSFSGIREVAQFQDSDRESVKYRALLVRLHDELLTRLRIKGYDFAEREKSCPISSFFYFSSIHFPFSRFLQASEEVPGHPTGVQETFAYRGQKTPFSECFQPVKYNFFWKIPSPFLLQTESTFQSVADLFTAETFYRNTMGVLPFWALGF